MTRSRPWSQRSDLRTLLAFFVFVVVVENVLVIVWACANWGVEGWPSAQSFSFYGVAMLCSGAASLAGGLIGFLFGIPRSDALIEASPGPGTPGGVAGDAGDSDTKRSSTPLPTARTGMTTPDGKLRPNTNLESISDGLTKALLGIGLTQLYKANDWVREIARIIGPSFGTGSAGKIIGLSVLAYGGLAGFFFGYLATRVFLTGAFERADSGQLQR